MDRQGRLGDGREAGRWIDKGGWEMDRQGRLGDG